MSVATIDIKGKEYAKVADRLKEFRQDNPRSKHESDYIIGQTGAVIFKVWLWKDKADLLELMKSGVTDKDILRSSADANGTAKSDGKGEKDFEKLESIALGRALANLGYLSSGEIASFEEMEEFNKFRNEKKSLAIEQAEILLKSSKTLTELQDNFTQLEAWVMREVIPLKDDLKIKLGGSSENS